MEEKDKEKHKMYGRYEVISKLGEGAFSKVYKGKITEKTRKMSTSGNQIIVDENKNKSNENKNNANVQQNQENKISDSIKSGTEFVALKKLNNIVDSNGMDFSQLREIKILKEISYHPNIIRLVDVFVEKNTTFLVMEFMKLDLEKLIQDPKYVITPADIKSIMKQVMDGLQCLHKNWILHRDMKPGNVLISEKGVIKISDFGSSRYHGSPNRPLTGRVTTRFYRAPEMLFGTKFYGPAVDIWSAGCIFAELLLRRYLFPGTSEIDQLSKIFALRGTPDEKSWPELLEMPNYIPFEATEKVSFSKIIPKISTEALDLLERMLDINPNTRIKTEEILDHEYFKTGPKIEEATYQDYIKKTQKF